jgi:hypothetical protein
MIVFRKGPQFERRGPNRRLVGVIQECSDMQWAYAARRWPGLRL